MQLFANIRTTKDAVSVSFITRPTNRENVTAEEKIFAKNVLEALAKDPKFPKMTNFRTDK